MEHRTLKTGETTFATRKQGLLVTEVGEYTEVMYYIPRVKRLAVTTLGSNVTVQFGKALKITMPDGMWAEQGDAITVAAMGEDVFG